MDKANITLEIYEGPLDLLLALIAKNEVDIADIPIREITSQYLKYIYMLNSFNIEVATEFIVMASTLIEIKSRMMLPPGEEEGDEDFDPREELVRRLTEYRYFKLIADYIRPNETDFNRTLSRDPVFDARLISPEKIANLDASLLAKAMSNILVRRRISIDAVKDFYSVDTGLVSVEEMIVRLESLLEERPSLSFYEIVADRSASDTVASFLAILELFKRDAVRLSQSENYGDILIIKNEVWNP